MSQKSERSSDRKRERGKNMNTGAGRENIVWEKRDERIPIGQRTKRERKTKRSRERGS